MTARLTAGPRPTTWIAAPRLGERLGVDLTLASETFQVTGSFKYRAAWNLAANVAETTIVTASSGNFGQALAAACRELGKRAVIVMPESSARVKIEGVVSYGAEVVLIDTRRISRNAAVDAVLAREPGAYRASAFDDPWVIAGNASLGREIAAVVPPFDAVIAPVGGGGLTAGIVTGLAEGGAATAVWGAEPLLANDAARSLAAGQIVGNDGEPQTIADGTRTNSLGVLNFAILHHGLAGIVEVPEEAIREGVRLLFALANLKAEPTGALPIGALLAEPEPFRGRRVACVVSGGNVDPALYAELVG